MNKIKYFRKKLNLSQKELADKLQINQSTVAMWEIGASSPRIILLPKLAKIFKCEISELFEE